MIRGINHITITVSDLDASLDFYQGLLGFHAHCRWHKGAYLSAGDLWWCLNQGEPQPAADYTHYAFSIDERDIGNMIEKLSNAGVKAWQPNQSEGASLYFLDPDGHQLELHVGSLESRLASLKQQPYAGLQW